MTDSRIRRICDFMSRYAIWLFGSGSTCIRLEKNLHRMAEAAGVEAEVTILPRHIHLAVREPVTGDVVTTISSIKAIPVSYDTITRLSR
ncbi:MAG: threonine/serine exporter family protein, partial [Muribaculaceae bacterium]|nr:threonine/serine exporter family protein [Muribaculaceae bacterium]